MCEVIQDQILIPDTPDPITQPVQGENLTPLFHFTLCRKCLNAEQGWWCLCCSASESERLVTTATIDICVKGTANMAG